MWLARMIVCANQDMKEMAKTCVQVGAPNSKISNIHKKTSAHAHWLRPRQFICYSLKFRGVKVNWIAEKSREHKKAKWQTGSGKLITFKFRKFKKSTENKNTQKAKLTVILKGRTWSLRHSSFERRRTLQAFLLLVGYCINLYLVEKECRFSIVPSGRMHGHH